MDEKSLIHKAQKDPRHFGKIYEIYSLKIHSYFLARVNYDEEVAKDLASATFEKCLKSLRKFRWEGIPFSAWLYKIAHNTLIDYYRKASKTNSYDESIEYVLKDESINIENSVIQADTNERLNALLRNVSDREKEIIGLKFFEGYTNKAIAKKLNLSETNVGTIVYRATKNLRDNVLSDTEFNTN